MRIPPGVPGHVIAMILEKHDLEVKQTDYGPIIYGEKEELEDVQDIILKALNKRVKK